MWVSFAAQTPLGLTVLFFEPQAARTLGVELQKVGSASESSLLLAKGPVSN
jgi:hypothetical protein